MDSDSIATCDERTSECVVYYEFFVGDADDAHSEQHTESDAQRDPEEARRERILSGAIRECVDLPLRLLKIKRYDKIATSNGAFRVSFSARVMYVSSVAEQPRGEYGYSQRDPQSRVFELLHNDGPVYISEQIGTDVAVHTDSISVSCADDGSLLVKMRVLYIPSTADTPQSTVYYDAGILQRCIGAGMAYLYYKLAPAAPVIYPPVVDWAAPFCCAVSRCEKHTCTQRFAIRGAPGSIRCIASVQWARNITHAHDEQTEQSVCPSAYMATSIALPDSAAQPLSIYLGKRTLRIEPADVSSFAFAGVRPFLRVNEIDLDNVVREIAFEGDNMQYADSIFQLAEALVHAIASETERVNTCSD